MLFPCLYIPRNNIDNDYNPPEMFEHAVKTKVGFYQGNGDGQSVTVYEERWPASFFVLEVEAGRDSVGDIQPGYTVNFGTGMGKLAFELARQIAKGMVGFESIPFTTPATEPTYSPDEPANYEVG